jgi:drug/metabolite transporter (DMT)-like permease
METIFLRFKQIIGDIVVDIILGTVSVLIATVNVFKSIPKGILAAIGSVILVTSIILQQLSMFGEYPTMLFGISIAIYAYLTSTSKHLRELASRKDVRLD